MSIQLKIKSFFSDVSIDSITAKFTQMVAELEALASRHAEVSDFHQAQRDESQALAIFHDAESARATKIKAKIEALIK